MDEKDKYVEKDTETESMNSSPTPISVSSLVESTNNKYKNDQTNDKKKISYDCNAVLVAWLFHFTQFHISSGSLDIDLHIKRALNIVQHKIVTPKTNASTIDKLQKT